MQSLKSRSLEKIFNLRKRPPGPPLANRAWAKTGIWLKRAWAGNVDVLNLNKCKNTIRICRFWAPIKWPADER